MKRMKATVLSSALALSMLITPMGYAANYDIKHKTDSAKNTSISDILDNDDKFDEVVDHIGDYLIEYDSKDYDLKAYDEKWNEMYQKNKKLVKEGKIKDEMIFGTKDLPEGAAPVEPLKPSENSTSELKVVSVSAINAKEIKVVFRSAVAKSSAETMANYVLTKANTAAVAPTISKAELQEDNKSVILTLNDATALNNKETAKYLVSISNVVTPENKKMAEYSQLLNLFDNVAPEVMEVTYPDSNTVKVSFSEPLNTISTGVASATKITSEGVNVAVPAAAYKLAADKKSFTIDVSKSGLSTDKDYTMVIDSIMDFAQNKLTKYEKVIRIAKDEEKPEVADLKALSINSIQVTFNEKVDASAINNTFKFKIDGSVATASITNPSNDGKTFIAVYTAPVPVAGNKVVTIYDYKDLSANQGKSYTKEIVFAVSNPEFTNTVGTLRNILGTNYIVFKLDREITLANPANWYTAKYIEDGVEKVAMLQFKQKAGVPQLAKDEVAIDTTALPAGGDYTVTVAANQIKDAFGQTNLKTEITFKYDAATVNATVMNVMQKAAPDLDTVVVTFSKDMGPEALDVSKYTVDGVQVFESGKFVGDRKTLHLKLKSGAITKSENKIVKVAGITGLDDKIFDGVAPNPAKIAFQENVRPEVSKVEIIALDKIRMTFSETVTAAIGDFEVKINGVKPSLPLTLSGSGESVLVIQLNVVDKLPNGSTPVTVEVLEGSNVGDGVGNQVLPIVKSAVLNLEDTEQEAVNAIGAALEQFDFAGADDGALAAGKTVFTARAAYDQAVTAFNNHAIEIPAGTIQYQGVGTPGTATEVLAVLKAAVLTAEAEDFAKNTDLTQKANYDELFDGASSKFEMAKAAKDLAVNAKIVAGDTAKTDLNTSLTAIGANKTAFDLLYVVADGTGLIKIAVDAATEAVATTNPANVAAVKTAILLADAQMTNLTIMDAVNADFQARLDQAKADVKAKLDPEIALMINGTVLKMQANYIANAPVDGTKTNPTDPYQFILTAGATVQLSVAGNGQLTAVADGQDAKVQVKDTFWEILSKERTVKVSGTQTVFQFID